MSSFELFLLGSPRLLRDGNAVTFDSRKNLALIAYLAITGRSHTREVLITLLWPELDSNHGRSGLRRNLSVIKKALGGEWLVVDREIISYDPAADFRLDVTQFRTHLQAWQDHGHSQEDVCPRCIAALTEAVELYQGDFMAGFSLRDSANFDEWQFFQTEGLQQELATTLERLVQGNSAQADYKSAIPFARRWLALDPQHEPAHRALIELYDRIGQHSAALRQYEACAQLLEAELRLPPSEETTALYEKLRRKWKDQRGIPRHNLPLQVTPFVGRECVLGEVQARLSDPDCRLLTLVGAGGIGKTRLALRAAELVSENQNDRFKHGVYFVPLGGVQSPENIVPAVAEALDFSFFEGYEPRSQLLRYLRQKRMLLVMDNMEHLLEGVELLTEILQTAPEVKLLATSRVGLNLQDEHLLLVKGMEIPDQDAGEEARDSSAVRLFAQGARRTMAGPGWRPTSETLGDVISICRLVEGVPLGILLAAAWVEMLSPTEIAVQIRQNLDFLESDLKDLPARQRSMRAVFDHSWRLLTERERSVMRALSVFRGGFTVEAAHELVGASLRDLKALIGKSFLEREAEGRYQVHELLRYYAAEKLDEMPNKGNEARDRHCAFFCQRLQALHELEMEFRVHEQLRTLAKMDADLENIRSAWNWAVDRRLLGRIEQASWGLKCFYRQRGLYQEGEASFGRAVQEIGKIKDARGRRLLLTLLFLQGEFNADLGLYSLARQAALDSLAILDEVQLAGYDLRLERARILYSMTYSMGDFKARQRLYEQSLALYQEIGDRSGAAMVFGWLGWTAMKRGEIDKAYELVEQGLAIQRTLGDKQGEAFSVRMLGIIAGRQGRYKQAESLLRESIAAFEVVGNIIHAGHCQGRLAQLIASQGRFSEALAHYRKAIAVHSDRGGEEGHAYWQIWAADSLVHLGEYDTARAEVELARAHYRHGSEWWRARVLYQLGRLALVREAYPQARKHLEEASRLQKACGASEGLALTCVTLACVDLGKGDLERAGRQLVEGLAIARHIKYEYALISGLPALALLLAHRGELERAVEVYTTALCDPVVQNSRWFQEVVGERIREATAGLLPEVVQKAEARSRERDPINVLEEILAELDK